MESAFPRSKLRRSWRVGRTVALQSSVTSMSKWFNYLTGPEEKGNLVFAVEDCFLGSDLN